MRASGFDAAPGLRHGRLVARAGGAGAVAAAGRDGHAGSSPRLDGSQSRSRAASSASDPARTLYLIASKSGTTTETLAFLAHFWQLEDDIHTDIPQGEAGEHFIAISDQGGSVESIPHSDLFRESFLNPEDVGGRYWR